jgi:hypothetical protein
MGIPSSNHPCLHLPSSSNMPKHVILAVVTNNYILSKVVRIMNMNLCVCNEQDFPLRVPWKHNLRLAVELCYTLSICNLLLWLHDFCKELGVKLNYGKAVRIWASQVPLHSYAMSCSGSSDSIPKKTWADHWLSLRMLLSYVC